MRMMCAEPTILGFNSSYEGRLSIEQAFTRDDPESHHQAGNESVKERKQSGGKEHHVPIQMTCHGI